MIEPQAGSVPGTNDAARFDAPSATSSRLGLIEYPKRDPFCLAATILSRNPMTQINLQEGFNVAAGKESAVPTWRLRWFVGGI